MEKQVIQSVGFRNVVRDGKVWGFQFRIRLPYYRGVYLSQVKPGNVEIDGKIFTKDDVLWNLGGVTYTWQEMLKAKQVHWHPLELVTIMVPLEGGLQQGYHDLTYGYCCTHSYMPPSMEALSDPTKKEVIYLVEFGHNLHSRRLLIV